MSAASSVGYRAMEDELPIATRRDQGIAETALQKVAQFLLKEHRPEEVDKAFELISMTILPLSSEDLSYGLKIINQGARELSPWVVTVDDKTNRDREGQIQHTRVFTADMSQEHTLAVLSSNAIAALRFQTTRSGTFIAVSQTAFSAIARYIRALEQSRRDPIYIKAEVLRGPQVAYTIDEAGGLRQLSTIESMAEATLSDFSILLEELNLGDIYPKLRSFPIHPMHVMMAITQLVGLIPVYVQVVADKETTIEDGKHFLLDRREPNIQQFTLSLQRLLPREEMSQMTLADISRLMDSKKAKGTLKDIVFISETAMAAMKYYFNIRVESFRPPPKKDGCCCTLV